VARLDRDGITGTGYLALATWGWFLYGFGSLLPQLGRDQGISRSLTGLHSVALATGGLIAGLSAVALVRAMHRRGVLRLGGLLVAVGCLLLAIGGGHTWASLPAVLITGTGGALMINTVNPALTDHHGQQSAAALSEGNAVAVSCGLVAPLVAGAGVAIGLTWRPAVLLTIPLAISMIIVLARQPLGAAALDTQLPPRLEHPTRLPAAFWPAAGMLVACAGVEFCVTTWSADLLREQVGLSAGWAAAGVSAVITGMTLGRLVAGRLALRYPPRPLLLIAIGLAALGWACTWLSHTPATALAGLFLTGIGIAGHYPIGAALVFASAEHAPDQAAGVLSIGISVAAGGGPFVLGALADASSTHRAFLLVPALLTVAVLLLWRSTWGARQAPPVVNPSPA
jgi:MFS family permease